MNQSDLTWALLSRREYGQRYDELTVSSRTKLDAWFREAESADKVWDVRAMREFGADLARHGNTDLGVGAIRDGVLIRDSAEARVTADIVEPLGEGSHPVLVYIHGGAWQLGRARDYRQLAFRYAESGFVVINVDYRLAPEAPFPAGYEDCEYAVRWAAEVAAEYGGDPAQLAIGGDSAGCNLAAAVAGTLASDPQGPKIGAALLIYGIFDLVPWWQDPPASAQDDSRALILDAYFGSDWRADEDALLADPRVSPLHIADKLPPSFVVVGSEDPLLAQSATLATALARADIEHEYVVESGVPHNFMNLELAYPQSRRVVDSSVSFLKSHLLRARESSNPVRPTNVQTGAAAVGRPGMNRPSESGDFGVSRL
jgi:acetyl esterase